MLKKFRKRDWILLTLIVLIMIIGLSFSMIKLEGKSVRVIKDNVVIDILSLTEDTEKDYIFNDNQNKLVINNGKAEVVSANCKNQICVNSEAIDEVGETIACLPHGLIFEVIEN